MAELISVIVTTYNREDALDAVLRSLARQTDADFEVVVADDGSAPATADLIEAWKAKVGHRLEHVWHEDRGFRAAEIRNRAILASRGAYCIFLDGDCIVRPDFVAIHRRLAEPGWFVTGNRILLSRELTAKVLREKLRRKPGASPLARRALARRRQSPVGAAASAARTAAPAASARLARRALLQSGDLALAISIASTASMPTTAAGARRIPISSCACCMPACAARTAAFATGVIHLWHAEADRSWLPDNERKLADIIASDRIRAQRGLSALRPAAATAMARVERWRGFAIASTFDRARLAAIADGLAIAVAVSLPWSTSATSILLVALAARAHSDARLERRSPRTGDAGGRLAGAAVPARRARNAVGRCQPGRALEGPRLVFQAAGDSAAVRAISPLRARIVGLRRLCPLVPVGVVAVVNVLAVAKYGISRHQ